VKKNRHYAYIQQEEEEEDNDNLIIDFISRYFRRNSRYRKNRKHIE